MKLKNIIIVIPSFLPAMAALPQQSQKPNVLFIIVDDLRPELGCYGLDAIKTPNISLNSEGNYIYTDKLVALIDTDNLIVVDTPDALLITKKESAEKVKDVVALLEKMGWKDYL